LNPFQLAKDYIHVELCDNGEYITELRCNSIAQVYATLREVIDSLENGEFLSNQETTVTDKDGKVMTVEEAQDTINRTKAICDRQFQKK
jgi:hypothetical protein